MSAPCIPIPPGRLRTNEDEAKWLEATILLRTKELLALAGVTAQITPSGLYDLLLLSLKAASARGAAWAISQTESGQ